MSFTKEIFLDISSNFTGSRGLVEQAVNNKVNNKNVIFQPKVMITKKDVEEIPGLKELREAIKYWEERLKTAGGFCACVERIPMAVERPSPQKPAGALYDAAVAQW